jgi:hypothetical protein
MARDAINLTCSSRRAGAAAAQPDDGAHPSSHTSQQRQCRSSHPQVRHLPGDRRRWGGLTRPGLRLPARLRAPAQAEWCSSRRDGERPPRNRTIELVASSGSVLTLVLLCNKVLLPVRVPITIARTPPIARALTSAAGGLSRTDMRVRPPIWILCSSRIRSKSMQTSTVYVI